MASDIPDRYPFVSDVPETKNEAQKEVYCVSVWMLDFFFFLKQG